MRQRFLCSLCYQGLRGGVIYADDNSIVYKSQTFTILEAYRNIVIPIKEIRRIEKGRMLLLPTVIICLQSQKYQFVIYSRKKFLKKAGIENLINYK